MVPFIHLSCISVGLKEQRVCPLSKVMDHNGTSLVVLKALKIQFDNNLSFLQIMNRSLGLIRRGYYEQFHELCAFYRTALKHCAEEKVHLSMDERLVLRKVRDVNLYGICLSYLS